MRLHRGGGYSDETRSDERDTNQRAAAAFLDPGDPTAWETEISVARSRATLAEVREREMEGERRERTTTTRSTETDDIFHFDRTRLKLIALQDAVLLDTKGLRTPPKGGEEGFDVDTLDEPPPGGSRSQQHRERRRNRREDEQPVLSEPEPEEIHHSWTIHSPDGCSIGEVWKRVDSIAHGVIGEGFVECLRLGLLCVVSPWKTFYVRTVLRVVHALVLCCLLFSL